IIDYRSPFTAMHSAGVAASARELARLYGMSEEDCKKMEIAGRLHDVGRLRVPNSILEKPGKLTDDEFDIVKEHPYYTRKKLWQSWRTM
ncbi:MAG: HD domain-containing protein, partial [Lachnospiraceae bacterium]|nr:HD domain-containing protein [Lachnospiraceae bacterium]